MIQRQVAKGRVRTTRWGAGTGAARHPYPWLPRVARSFFPISVEGELNELQTLQTKRLQFGLALASATRTNSRLSMGPYAAVIFDLDGVIVNSEPLHEAAFRDVFADLGYGENHGVHFPEYYGKSDHTLWLDFIARHRPPHDLESLTRQKQTRFLRLLDDRKPVFARIPELLERLASRTRLAVASGSTHEVINAALELNDLRRFFSVIVSSQDVPRGKPAPDIFLRAADLLKIRPEDCVVIEDSAAGVSASKAAGMRVIAITNSLPASALQAADAVVSDYAQIEQLLLTIDGS